MGGYGSGRWGGYRSRQTVESSHVLSADQAVGKIGYALMHQQIRSPRAYLLTAQRAVMLLGYANPTGSAPMVTLEYTVTLPGAQNPIPMKYPVYFTSTLHHNTGRSYYRFYWRCTKCGRRCSKLYLPPGALTFACRACHRLIYYSQTQTKPPRRLAGWVKALDREVRVEKAFEQLHGSRRQRRQRIEHRIATLLEID
jgi:hypothetical protein